MKKAAFHETCYISSSPLFFVWSKGFISWKKPFIIKKTLSFLDDSLIFFSVDPGWVMRSQANVCWNWPAKPCYEYIVAAAQCGFFGIFLGSNSFAKPEKNTRKMGTPQKCRRFFWFGFGKFPYDCRKNIKVWWNIIPGMARIQVPEVEISHLYKLYVRR